MAFERLSRTESESGLGECERVRLARRHPRRRSLGLLCGSIKSAECFDEGYGVALDARAVPLASASHSLSCVRLSLRRKSQRTAGMMRMNYNDK